DRLLYLFRLHALKIQFNYALCHNMHLPLKNFITMQTLYHYILKIASNFLGISLISSPGGGGKEDQQRKEFQPSCQHIKYQHALGERRKQVEVFHGAHLIQSRADIVQRSGHRRKICGEAVIVQTDQKHGEGSDQHIGDEKDIDGPHRLMGDRMAGHLDLFDSPRMGKGEKILYHRFCHDQEAGYLDDASGAPGAGSCKHQNQQQGFGQLRPEVKICRGISGGGDDGSHLKGRVTQRLAQSGKKAADIPGHDQDGGSDDSKVGFQFLGAESLTEFPAEDQVVDIEINAEQNHKNGYDHLQMRGIAGHAVVFDTESSGAGGAERDAESVKDGHLSDDQQDDLKQSHGGIDSIQD